MHQTSRQSSEPEPQQTPPTTAAAESEKQAELLRAKELVDLHYGVKVKHMSRGPELEPAVDEGLRRAREDVNRVLREVNTA